MSRKGRQKRRMHLESKCVLPDQPESSVLRSIRSQPHTYETCSQDLHRCQARQRDPLPIGAVRQQDPLRSRNGIRVLLPKKACLSVLPLLYVKKHKAKKTLPGFRHGKDAFQGSLSQDPVPIIPGWTSSAPGDCHPNNRTISTTFQPKHRIDTQNRNTAP